jgi:hypothetical protein
VGGSPGRDRLGGVPVLLLLAALLVLAVALIPVSLVLRFRTGTARRRARGWIATINVAGFGLSIGLFLLTAAVTNTWAPGTFTYALGGVAAGVAVGLLGTALTRWEVTPQGLYYTPNAWLVLTLTLAVTGRILYGTWRGWQAWGAVSGDRTWIAEAGVAGSMGVGAVVLAYYFTYWAAVRRRVARTGR